MKSPHSPILPVFPVLRFPLCLAALAGLSLVTPAFAVVNIDYVIVGNAGNDYDPNGPASLALGAVDYVYRIAKNETSISDYAQFLNAVAATDTYELYSSLMTYSTVNGITQSGISGSFTYSVAAGSGNKPITMVNWFDAARFANWMHNGQASGEQNASTTEDGAYSLNGATSGVGIVRNVGATVWIPSQNEWYKAAYYDPNKDGVGLGGYWAFATQSDTISGNTVGVATSGNYFDGDYVGSGNGSFPTSNALTDGGAYGLNSASAYGTNDQSGNVREWTDAVVGSGRVLRGGSYASTPDRLTSGYYEEITPTGSGSTIGFRVASVQEPSSIVFTLLTSGTLLLRRKRGSGLEFSSRFRPHLL